jgi:hypothetical protein
LIHRLQARAATATLPGMPTLDLSDDEAAALAAHL